MRSRTRTVTRTLQVAGEATRSITFTTEAGEEVTLPRSEITMQPADRFGWHDVTMPDWLARDRGLK